MGGRGHSQQGQMDAIVGLRQIGKQVAGGQGQAPTQRQIGGKPGGSKFGIRQAGFGTLDERREEVDVPPGGAQINFVPRLQLLCAASSPHKEQQDKAKQRVRVEDSEPSHAFAISYKIPIAC